MTLEEALNPNTSSIRLQEILDFNNLPIYRLHQHKGNHLYRLHQHKTFKLHQHKNKLRF